MFGVGIHAILFCTPLIRHLVVVMFTAFTNPLTSRCRNRSVMLTFGIQTHYEAIVQLNKFLHKIYFIGRFFSRSTPINPMNSIDLNCVIIAGGLYHMFQCLCWFVFGFEFTLWTLLIFGIGEMAARCEMTYVSCVCMCVCAHEPTRHILLCKLIKNANFDSFSVIVVCLCVIDPVTFQLKSDTLCGQLTSRKTHFVIGHTKNDGTN